MALIKCNECGKEISDKATTCVYCGNPIKKQIISNKNWKELTSQEKNIIKKDLEEKNDKLTTKKSLVAVFGIFTIIGVIIMFVLDSILSPFVCLALIIIFGITLYLYQNELKKTYEKFFNTNSNYELSQDTTLLTKNISQQKKEKKNFKKGNLLVGLIIGVIIVLIFFYILQVVKTNINNSKCKSGYTYDETYNLCTQRKRTLRDQNGNCPNGYGYNDYDNTCVRYNEYKP